MSIEQGATTIPVTGSAALPSEPIPQKWVEAYELVSKLYLLRANSPEIEQAIPRIVETINDKIRDPSKNSDLNELVLLYSYYSLQWIPDYSTLDSDHIKNIHRVIEDIVAYVNDTSLERPLNFLLLAAPGSGKSQLIKSIIKYLRMLGTSIGEISFNMATMHSKDDLGRILDGARNVAIDDKLPLVFLDEFDSNDGHYPLLLPLLWDGALDLGKGELRLGRSIFFLAGSRPTLPTKLASARNMVATRTVKSDDSKLVDLFSRVNGSVIRVPSMTKSGKERKADKVVLAMALLRRRFPLCNSVPWAFLWFIANARFRYEIRSVATLINAIPLADGETAQSLPKISMEHLERLPLGKATDLKGCPLALHLIDRYGALGLTKLWRKALRYKEEQPLRHTMVEDRPPPPMPLWLLNFSSKLEAARGANLNQVT
jgi:hypothetical protein